MFFKMIIFLFIGILVHPSQNLPTATPEFVLHDRASWGARSPTDTRPLTTPVPYVVIHHTYIPGACHSEANCSKAMRSMQKYHMDTQNWGDIGYHFCIGSDGAVYEGRGWHVEGIHVAGFNKASVGICLIGDWRTERPPQPMLDSAQALIASGVAKKVLNVDYKLIGHNQATATECPGTKLLEEIKNWDNYSAGSLHA